MIHSSRAGKKVAGPGVGNSVLGQGPPGSGWDRRGQDVHNRREHCRGFLWLL